MSLFGSLGRFFPASSRSTLSAEQCSEKQEAILNCLQGRINDGAMQEVSHETSIMDLWELRDLALSPGGLLDATLRKRAWPILTSSHMSILNDANSSSRRSVPPSHSDLRTLRHDVKRTVWDVTECLHNKSSHTQNKSSHTQNGRSTEHSSNESLLSNTSSQRDYRRVSFAMDDNTRNASIDEHEEETIPPIRMTLTDTSEDQFTEEQHEATMFTTTSNPNDCSAISDVSNSFMSNGTTTGRRVRWRKASKYEQKVLANIITTVLRLSAPEHASYSDDRFHYFSGLHNLTAILLANLESPSLTSLVLGKLAVFHLRDAMRQDTAVAESALRLTLFPLLQQVDPVLHHHICVRSGLKESGFALSWITSWFASDVGNIAVASRLVDVFLVSHPMMPIYCVVALLISQRRRLLSCDPSLKSVYANLRSLDLMATLSMEDDENAYNQGMKQTEEIIASALRYIKHIPPQLLAELSEHVSVDKTKHESAIAMLSKTGAPSWCTDSSCPTEWEVLKRANAMRTGQVHVELRQCMTQSMTEASMYRYERAYAAAACRKPKQNVSAFCRILFWGTLVIAATYLLSAVYIHREASKITTVLPVTSVRSHSLQNEAASTPQILTHPPTFNNSKPLICERSYDFVVGSNHALAIVTFPPMGGATRPLKSEGRYLLTEDELDFEHFVLKPIHAFCGRVLNEAIKFAATHRFISRKSVLVMSSTLSGQHAKQGQVVYYSGSTTDRYTKESKPRYTVQSETEEKSPLTCNEGTLIVVLTNTGEKSPTRIQRLRQQLQQKIGSSLSAVAQKGKGALTSMLQITLKVSSANTFEPLMN